MNTKNIWLGPVIGGIILLVSAVVMAIIRATYDYSTATTMVAMIAIAFSGGVNLTRGLMLRNSVKK